VSMSEDVEEIVEENLIGRALTSLEARVIVFLAVFGGILLALLLDKITPDQFMALLSTNGLLYMILKKNG